MYDGNSYDRVPAESRAAAAAGGFINRVYGWMTIGMALTAMFAYAVANFGPLYRVVYQNRAGFPILIVAEVVLVMVLSAGINRISAPAAGACFIGYSALNGLTMGWIFFAYSISGIAQAFFITSLTFAAMSAYGYVTRRNLATVGGFAAMLLIGAVIAMVVNMFLRNDAVDLVISWVCVGVFVILTAWDTQKIKHLAEAADGGMLDGQVSGKYAVIGALTLYLDFVNLFLMLLRLLGNRRR